MANCEKEECKGGYVYSIENFMEMCRKRVGEFFEYFGF